MRSVILVISACSQRIGSGELTAVSGATSGHLNLVQRSANQSPAYFARCGDAPQGENILDRFEKGEVGTIVADAAYDSDAICRRYKVMKSKVCIKPNKNRKVKKRYDKKTYRNRNQIERFFGQIKHCRMLHLDRRTHH